MSMLRETQAPAATLLIRLAVGATFFSEGIQKFLFPAALGAGRFAKLGLPDPRALAPFVGACEIVFGALIILGLLTRLSTIPLLIVISVAIITTKIPELSHGFWSTAHDARIDVAMLLGLLFLLFVGAGSLSLDARGSSHRR